MQDKKNLRNLAWLSYSLTTITGIAVVLPFIIKDAAAAYFHSSLEYMGYVFGFFMLGMMFLQWINGYIVKYISIRTEIYFLCLAYIIASGSMFLLPSAESLIPVLILMGAIFGAVITLPNYIIVNSFHGAERSSKLNKIDFWFSVGSLAYPLVAAWMLEQHFSWQAVYFSVSILVVIVALFAARSQLPNISDKANQGETQFSKWTVNVWLIGLGVFFFFMSYVGYTYWLTDYITKYLHMSPATGDFGESLFWTTYAVGCFISSYIVHYIAVNKYIIISGILSVIAYFLVYYSTNIMMLYLSVSLLGLGCSTIYSSSISFGTLLLKKPSPRVVSFLVVASGIGTYTAQIFSTWVEGSYGMPALTVVSAVLMLLSVLSYVYVSLTNKIKSADLHKLH